MNPKCLGFVYRQFCQSMCVYGLEVVKLSKAVLKQIDIRQNILLKTSLGLPKKVKTTPLLEALKVPRLTELYFLFKIKFLRQIKKNGVADSIFKELLIMKQKHTKVGNSFLGQIADVNGFLGTDCLTMSESQARDIIKTRFCCQDTNLVKQINDIFTACDERTDIRALLLPLLRIDFGAADEFESDSSLTDATYAALQ